MNRKIVTIFDTHCTCVHSDATKWGPPVSGSATAVRSAQCMLIVWGIASHGS